jgi:hypothetical protein
LIYAEIFFLSLLIAGCEGKDRFYRPDLPEKLCSIGIIDVDDTTNFIFSIRNILDARNSTRYLTFEKSFQSEYQANDKDSLKELGFTISTATRTIINFQSESTLKNLYKLELPDSLNFYSGETYFLRASVKSLPEIEAASLVPYPPENIVVNSVTKEVVPIHLSTPCDVRNIANSVSLDISFKNNGKGNYYMILLIANGTYYKWSNPYIPYTGPVDFSVRETNSPGFFSEMQGLNTMHINCSKGWGSDSTQASGYFINGDLISGESCQIKLNMMYNDGTSPLEELKTLRLKLLSIPEDLYYFEKNLHNYDKIKDDPFSEPVYLKGNITNGNGVFAVCRSSNLDIDLSEY